jgi:hypothetical protein
VTLVGNRDQISDIFYEGLAVAGDLKNSISWWCLVGWTSQEQNSEGENDEKNPWMEWGSSHFEPLRESIWSLATFAGELVCRILKRVDEMNNMNRSHQQYPASMLHTILYSIQTVAEYPLPFITLIALY